MEKTADLLSRSNKDLFVLQPITGIAVHDILMEKWYLVNENSIYFPNQIVFQLPLPSKKNIKN